MNVAITGASGQLGTLLLRRLIDNRSIKSVVALDVRPPALVSAKLRAVTADVRDKDIARHLAGCDAIIHCAFIVVAHVPRDVAYEVNVEGSKNVFRAAESVGVKNVVYASSIAAYGVVPGHPVPLTESAPRIHQPDFIYSATKYEVEAFLDEFEREHPAIAITRLRPSILIGTRMDHPLGASLRRRVLPAIGDSPLPIVWDEDVADAAMLALAKSARGAFNLCADELLPAGDLARRAGLRPLRLPVPAMAVVARAARWFARTGLFRSAQDPSWLHGPRVEMIPSSERAKRELGWNPRCKTAVDVLRRFDETAPRRLDPRIALFMTFADRSARSAPPMAETAHVSARVHLALTGRSGGDFSFIIDHGRARIRRGAPRPPTAVITLGAETFLELLSGRIDVSAAQMTGKVRSDGEAMALMYLGGLIATFRNERSAPGPRGWIARRLSGWFGESARESRAATP